MPRYTLIEDVEGPAMAASVELVYTRDCLEAIDLHDQQGDAVRDQLRDYLREIGEHRALGLLAAYEVHEDAEDDLREKIAGHRTAAHAETKRIAGTVERLCRVGGDDGDDAA